MSQAAADQKVERKHLIVGAGTFSANIVSRLYEIHKKRKATAHHRYIVVDTGSSINTLNTKVQEIETVVIGKSVCNEEGSGMSPALAYRAFQASREEFLTKVGLPEQIASARVIGAPARGGTAAGIQIPICLALRKKGITTTPCVIAPAIATNSIGSSQTSFFTQVHNQLQRRGFKSYFPSEDWISETANLKTRSYNAALQALIDELALAIASQSLFLDKDPNRLMYLDPNDWRRVQQGDGYLKFALETVDLEAEDEKTEIKRALDAITKHNLYHFPKPVGAVVPYFIGEGWKVSQRDLVFRGIFEYICQTHSVDPKENPNKVRYYMKSINLDEDPFVDASDNIAGRVTGTPVARLAIQFASMPEQIKVEEEEFPQFDEESPVEDLSAAFAEDATQTEAVATAKFPCTRSFETARELIEAARKRDKNARWVFSAGDPRELVRYKIRTPRGILPVLCFELGPEFGRTLTEYGTGKDKHKLLLELLGPIRLWLSGEEYSLAWQECIREAVLGALWEQGFTNLPRYILNDLYKRRELPRDLTPDELRGDFDWSQVRDRELKKGKLSLAWACLVRVALEGMVSAETLEPLLEPADNRTRFQKIRAATWAKTCRLISPFQVVPRGWRKMRGKFKRVGKHSQSKDRLITVVPLEIPVPVPMPSTLVTKGHQSAESAATLTVPVALPVAVSLLADQPHNGHTNPSPEMPVN